MARNLVCGMVLAVLVGCGGTSAPPRVDRVAKEDDARTIIEKAIKAQGGADKLGQLRAGRWKGRGTANLKGRDFPVAVATIYQMPDKYKTAIHLNVQGKKISMLQVLDGDKGWLSGEGKLLDLEADHLQALHEEFYRVNVEFLVPLLREKDYTLSRLEDAFVEVTSVVGVKVAAKGHKDIELYFDMGTFLPAKTVQPIFDTDSKKLVTEEIIYGGIKESDGFKYPSRLVINRNGKQTVELTITEFKKLDTVDPKEFARPK